MTRIGIRELCQHASRYLDIVEAGGTVEVTERGSLVALLVPLSPATAARDSLVGSPAASFRGVGVPGSGAPQAPTRIAVGVRGSLPSFGTTASGHLPRQLG